MTDVPPDASIDDLTESFLGDVDSNGTQPPIDSFGSVEYETPVETETIDEGFVEDTQTTIGDGACVVCGAPTFRPPGLTKTGRKKRAPKYCDLHTPNARVSHERPSSQGVDAQLRQIQEELADDLRLLGTLAGPLFPVTGYYVFTQADPFVLAVLKLAKNNTRILRVLHRAAQVAPIYTVAETVAGTAFAVQVDTKKGDPHSTIARRLGVERAYEAVYPNDTPGDQTTVSTNGFAGPPRYATVQ